MQRTGGDGVGGRMLEKAIVYVVVIGAVLVLDGLCFALLRSVTRLPMWATAVISFASGIVFFYLFAKTHETNGFDGPLVRAEGEGEGGGRDRWTSAGDGAEEK